MSNAWIRDKVVLVTGAASGIGAATAAVLHTRGARLVLTDADEAGVRCVAATIGREALAVRADVTRLEELRAAVGLAVERFGGLDVVWANAGIGTFGPVAMTDPAAWERNIDVNLTGTFRTVYAALPEIIRRRGHVAVTASVASFVNVPAMSAYCAAKAGAEALCNSLRMEVAHHGVTVGAIHPSWVATPLVAGGQAREAFRRLRTAFPAPLRRDMPLPMAAQAIARGIADRRARVYLPGYVRLIRWLRTPLHSTLAERDLRRAAPGIEDAFAQHVAELGAADASLVLSPRGRDDRK